MDWLALKDITKTYPGKVTALSDIDLRLRKGEFFTIVGPTNAGKSTLLKTIAGLERQDRGTIALKGRDLGALQPRERKVSLLFQNIALFPDRTGFENVAFPLRVAGMAEAAVKARVDEVANLLKVDHLLSRLPRTFSGGEQQRVAIGRAISHPADLLMLDEPLTNLDARIRIALRLEFKKLHRETGQTILYVTHDQIEALSMSDRIGVLNNGRFEQVGTPDDVYHRPASEFVARFIGSPPMNILPVELKPKNGAPQAVGSGFTTAVASAGPLPAHAAVGIRPEEIQAASRPSPETPFAGEVLWIEHLGSHQILDVKLGDHLIKVRTAADHPVESEGPAWFGFTVKSGRILDRDTKLFITTDRDEADLAKKEEFTCV
ncbi:ABC transporter ATP-binding protein [Taklimakanibacter deserti]|uniref:ABC transporter ATP-binding protein n=1 Tax=Taklimakanibacter deserti TaxID=2267839 RepID=UPI000E656C99